MLDHMTKRGISTQCSAIHFIFSLPLTCLNIQGETLLLLTSNFSSLLFLLYRFFSSFGASEIIPNCVLSKIYCILSKLFWDVSKMCLSQSLIASYRNYCKTCPNCVFAKPSSGSFWLDYSTELHPAVNRQYHHPCSVFVSGDFALT